MSLSHTEIFGLASDVISLMEHDKEKIKSFGIDVERLIAELKQLLKEALESNARQEHLKAEAKDETEKSVRLIHALHMKASGDLDMVISGYGKDSVESDVIRRTRSKIRRRENHDSVEEESAQATPQ